MSVRVSLTVSLSCPSVSALWPNRASAVSWKHVTHWLSPKSAKLAWELHRQRWQRDNRLFLSVCMCDYFSVSSTVCGKCVCEWQSICASHTYRKYKSVFKVGELSVTPFAAVLPVLLVYDFLVAICRWTGLIQTILLPSVYHCCHTAEIVCLKERIKKTNYGSRSIKPTKPHENAAIWTSMRLQLICRFSPLSKYCAGEYLNCKTNWIQGTSS